MKFVILLTSLLLICTEGYPCNQRIYDIVYTGIIQEALQKSPDDPDTFTVRNNRIEALRSLCNGQKSSYEINRDFSLDKKE